MLGTSSSALSKVSYVSLACELALGKNGELSPPFNLSRPKIVGKALLIDFDTLIDAIKPDSYVQRYDCM
jgi:hypothetical protein